MNPQDPLANLIPNLSGGLTNSLKLLIFFTILSFLPAIILTTSSFVRTVVVFSFLRQGLSVQTPPAQVITGLAIFITAFTMSPVLSQIQRDAYDPYQRGAITEAQALDAAAKPLRAFMLRQTRQGDLELFYAATQTPLPETPDDVPMRIAMPAFVVSELTTAFQMGVMILLPFLVIDLAVGSILMSMGMMFVSPAIVALPIKLMLFVLADGWNLLVGSLLSSFR